MNFTQGQPETMTNQKPNAKDKIKEGQAQIGNFAAKTAARPEVQAGITSSSRRCKQSKRQGF